MKNSLRRKIAGIFIAVMTGMILMCWVVNNFFLESFYISQKLGRIMDAYNTLNNVNFEENESTDFTAQLQILCETHNISVLVMDGENMTIQMAGVGNVQDMKFTLFNHLYMSAAELEQELAEGDLPEGADKEPMPPEKREPNENKPDRKRFYQGNGTVYEETPRYIIQRVNDRVSEIDYIEMWGFLDNDNIFMIRTTVAAIQDSVKLANTFLAYTGIFAIVLGAIIIWLTTRQITKPILQLSQISTKMSQLDFEAKYQTNHKRKNEIDQLGENINSLSESLEKTISELKTANNELQSDNERKTKVDEMRKEFLSNVTHELKTPIALIQGYAEGLKDGIADDPESTEFYCDVIIDEADKMNKMVKKLLTLNHLEFGTDAITMERFDIVTLIQNYLNNSAILIKQNELKVQFIENKPINVWGDEFKVEEVFMNYFSNAMNHVDDRRLIDIKITREKGKVRISVFNSGTPIPEDSIEHIWEKFYKVDKARTREYGGSGVGLSIVKAIMESMNQAYGVNNYDDGVEFWFELQTN